jgi:ribosomal protein L7/L12
VAEALDRGDKIAAMREYRKAIHANLRQAKDFVQEISARRATASS